MLKAPPGFHTTEPILWSEFVPKFKHWRSLGLHVPNAICEENWTTTNQHTLRMLEEVRQIFQVFGPLLIS